jgi:hypothetical protein
MTTTNKPIGVGLERFRNALVVHRPENLTDDQWEMLSKQLHYALAVGMKILMELSSPSTCGPIRERAEDLDKGTVN